MFARHACLVGARVEKELFAGGLAGNSHHEPAHVAQDSVNWSSQLILEQDLLGAAADINGTDTWGNTALHARHSEVAYWERKQYLGEDCLRFVAVRDVCFRWLLRGLAQETRK